MTHLAPWLDAGVSVIAAPEQRRGDRVCADLADAKQEGAPRKDVFQLGPHPGAPSAVLGGLRLLALAEIGSVS